MLSACKFLSDFPAQNGACYQARCATDSVALAVPYNMAMAPRRIGMQHLLGLEPLEVPQQHEGGTSETHPHTRTPSTQTSLLHFIRTKEPDAIVAVSQRGNQFGDIRYQETRDLARTSASRSGLFPHSGLNPSWTDREGQADQHDGEPSEGELFGEDIDPADEGQLDTSFPPLPPALVHPNDPFRSFAKKRNHGETEKSADVGDQGLGGDRLSSPARCSSTSDAVSKPKRNSQFWFECLASPVKKFAASAGLNLRPRAKQAQKPSEKTTEPREETTVTMGAGDVNKVIGRKDRPVTYRLRGRNRATQQQLLQALTKQKITKAAKAIEDDYYANSSKKVKATKQNTVSKILEKAESPLPLTPSSMKALTGVLKAAGYRSGHMYLVEAKMMHVEAGHPWPPLLDRHFKLCMTASKRGLGPAKKAEEVPEKVWAENSSLLSDDDTNTKVHHSRWLFAFSVHWMLRELEVATIATGDLSLDTKARLVTLRIPVSKTDTEAASVARTLQCLCEKGCDFRCPFAVAESLTNFAMLRGNPKSFLAYTKEGLPATKSDVVSDWQRLYGKGVTGHSGRRSGALQYIRKGWSVPQVAFLGRWKSNIILQYAQEALESMALNGRQKFGHQALELGEREVDDSVKSSNNMLHATADVSDQWKKTTDNYLALQDGIKEFKGNTKVATSKLNEAVQSLERQMANSAKYLPSYVKSRRHQVIHRNSRVMVYAPSYLWRTQCGWLYYRSDYEFVEGDNTMVSCQKCLGAA